jgi:RNA polymerase sigma-70 factor (ECF subfamily)
MEGRQERQGQQEPQGQHELHERLRAGDHGAWAAVLKEHGPALLGYARRLVGDEARAEEVVQEALVAVFGSIATFEGRGSFRGWLFRAVHNKAIDELRARKRYVDAEPGDPDHGCFGPDGRWERPCPDWEPILGARLDAKVLVERVREQLDALPHAHREVLLLKEVHGLSAEEICETLGISPGNLRIRIHRARKALRAAVGSSLEER